MKAFLVFIVLAILDIPALAYSADVTTNIGLLLIAVILVTNFLILLIVILMDREQKTLKKELAEKEQKLQEAETKLEGVLRLNLDLH